MQERGEYDYVVLGAGSAGCVLAARLTESGKHRVALIEAGGEDDNFWIRTPIGYGRLYDQPAYNWLYESEPEPELGGGKTFLPRGKVLGGTGSINGMIYVRGQREDYDTWRQLGNAGWGFDDVLPYFKKSEDNERGAGKLHGAGGPVRVSNIPRHELADAFVAAGKQAGYAENEDFNGPSQDGFGYNQVTIRRGRRDSTAAAFLRPARKRPNLAVFLNAHATRLLFRGRRVVGVEFRQGDELCTVSAHGEVLLAAGSFNSPQLLQVSGVGPASLLREHGIPVIADLGGVGRNLQDHFGVSTTYECSKPITINDLVRSPWRKLAMGVQYLLFRTGPMATNANVVGGCIRTDPTLGTPDVKLQMRLWGRAVSGRAKERMGLHGYSAFSVTTTLLRPDNRGTVEIRSPDSSVPPSIRFNYFCSERDRRATIELLRIIRKIMSMPAMAPYVAAEMKPGPSVATDAELLKYCRQSGTSNHHPTSTCRMGIDDGAVVDPRLRVRGVERLRVIDASIMPTLIGGNTNAPTVMIAEKGAAMVLEDAGSA